MANADAALCSLAAGVGPHLAPAAQVDPHPPRQAKPMEPPTIQPTSASAAPSQPVMKRGLDGDERTGVRRLDVTFPELRTEALQEPDLLVREGERAPRRGLLKAQPTV